MPRSEKPQSKPSGAHEALTADRRKKPISETARDVKTEAAEDHLDQRDELSRKLQK